MRARTEPQAAGAIGRALRSAGAVLLRLPRALAAALAIGWMAFIWNLSSGPIEVGGEGFGWAVLANLAHAPLFGLLALWSCAALPRRSTPFAWAQLDARAIALVLALVAAYGALDEWRQSRVSTRTPSAFDLATDLVGAAAVLLVVHQAGRVEASAARLWACLGLGSAACLAAALVAAW
jgi:VanZ family protein